MRAALFLLLTFIISPALAQERPVPALPPIGQDRPLPDAEAFAQEVRRRLQTDEERQGGYAYVETRTERKLDKTGQGTRLSVKVFESYPGLPGQGRWNRLIAVDGKPVPASELEKQDRERQKKVHEHLRKLEQQSDKDRASDARKREKARREDAEAIDEAFRVLEFRMLGREPVDGHETIVFEIAPRPGVKPRTREGGILQHVAGKVWVSESDFEPVRLEVEALDTLSFGLGLVARIHKGSHVAFQRRKVNGEDWLPARFAFTASARVMLVRSLRLNTVSEFSNYRKFTVATETRHTPPK